MSDIERIAALIAENIRIEVWQGDGDPRAEVDISDAAKAVAASISPPPSDTRNNVLEEALNWAFPLANLALEECRTERLRCGHDDIRGIDAKGNTIIGLHQSEIDHRDKARAALKSVEGE